MTGALWWPQILTDLFVVKESPPRAGQGLEIHTFIMYYMVHVASRRGFEINGKIHYPGLNRAQHICYYIL